MVINSNVPKGTQKVRKMYPNAHKGAVIIHPPHCAGSLAGWACNFLLQLCSSPYMTRLTLSLSLFAFIAIVFFSAPSAPAQSGGGFGLVQSNYDDYARLFKMGKEPNLSPIGNQRWRALYRNNRWQDYATGGEFREPMLAAQTLMGIYLVQHVDHQLTYQIENIIWNKAYLSASLAERITLDQIAMYWETNTDPLLEAKRDAVGQGDSFYSEDEIYRLQLQRRDLDVIARTRIINPNSISRGMKSEVQAVRNLFDHGERGDVPLYYFMREKFAVLDALAASFTFNWDLEKREAEIERMMQNPDLEREVRAEVRTAMAAAAQRRSTAASSSPSGGSPYSSDYGSSEYDSGSSDSGSSSDEFGGSGGPAIPDWAQGALLAAQAGGMTESEKQEQEQKAVDEALRPAAEAKLKILENRQNAYKYVVGVYESTDFHLGTLRKIERYFRNAAEVGDPIAQYHYALFMRYLGDIVYPYESEDGNDVLYRSEELLRQAEEKPDMKKRVENLKERLAIEETRKARRDSEKEKKIAALVKVENDKIDMFDTVLLSVRERISSGNNTGGRGGMNSMMGGGTSGGYGSGGNSGTGRSNSRSSSSSSRNNNNSSSNSSNSNY